MTVLVHMLSTGGITKLYKIESITYDGSFVRLWRTNQLVATYAPLRVNLEVVA